MRLLGDRQLRVGSRELRGLTIGLDGGDDGVAAPGELNGGVAAEAASGAGDEYGFRHECLLYDQTPWRSAPEGRLKV